MHLANDRLLFRAALFVMLAAAATARSQEVTQHLRFELVGVCRDVGTPKFVVNGNDGTEPKDVKRIDDSLTWTATWPELIAAEGSVASARLGGARTNSVRSKMQRKAGNIEAFFELKCGTNAAWNVTIQTDPHRNFGYLRYLKRFNEADVDSFEHEDRVFGTGKTYDVQLWDETLNLRLDRSLVIHLNSIPIFKKPKEGTSAQQTLDRNQIVEAVARSLFGTAFSSADRNAIRTKRTIRELDRLMLTRWVK